MSRIRVCAIVVMAALALGWVATANAKFDLTADQMKAALRTSTEEEEGFIDTVLAMVDAGTLPEDLVQSTFLWARKRTKHKFQYFKYAIRLRAADQGIIF